MNGFVDVQAAIIIGLVVSILSYFAVGILKPKFGYDDSLDVFGVHGIGGLWGMIATGLFSQKWINNSGADGLFYGNPGQLFIQIKVAALTILYCSVGTWVACIVADKLLGFRVSAEEEVMGLDLTQHHERAYTIID